MTNHEQIYIYAFKFAIIDGLGFQQPKLLMAETIEVFTTLVPTILGSLNFKYIEYLWLTTLMFR